MAGTSRYVDPRFAMVKQFFHAGWHANGVTAADFLRTVPPIPPFPEGYMQEFPRGPILVNGRDLSLADICRALQVRLETVADVQELYRDSPDRRKKFPAGLSKQPIYWMRMQEGTRTQAQMPQSYRGMKVLDVCLIMQDIPQEAGLTVLEGMAFMVVTPGILEGGQELVFTGSVLCQDQNRVASLKMTGGQATLYSVGQTERRPTLCYPSRLVV